MKSSLNMQSSDFAPASAARRMPRPFWGVAPVTHAALTRDLGHEAEVLRGLTLAVPLSLALWAPLIVAAVYLF